MYKIDYFMLKYKTFLKENLMQTITLKTESNENKIEIIKNKQKLDITPINSDDKDYKYILKGREERKKHPENYGSIYDIDWG